jgi:capsular polysaccharide biosynthesis protein
VLRRILSQVVGSLAPSRAPASRTDPIKEAELELADGDAAGAEHLLSGWVATHAEDAKALRLLGCALNRRGRHHEALQVALRALALRDEFKTREEIAHAHVGLRNIPAAFEVFAPVLAELSGEAIDAVKRAHARVSGDLDPGEMAATLRTAFLMRKNSPAAEACDRVLRPDDAAGEYRTFEIHPSLLDYCRQSKLPCQVVPEAELIPMGKSVPGAVRAHGYIGALPEGWVIGQSFIPATAEGLAFVERYVHNPGRMALWDRSIPSDIVRAFGGSRLLTRSGGVDRHKGHYLLVGNLANVGHWFLNHLARLWWLDRVPELSQAMIVVGANAWDSQLECLARMGIDRDRVLRIPAGRIAQFEQLWAPAMFYGAVGRVLYWWPAIVPFLRDGLRMQFAAPRQRRIFLTRRAARWRRLLNEAEVIDELASFGFEIIDPGTLSIAEQIEIAGSAQIIAGAFGAGMMLLMFATPGTPIVEFKYGNIGNSMDLHPVIARAIGLPYFGVVGEVRGDEPDQLKRDFVIAPGQARDTVRRALDSAGA